MNTTLYYYIDVNEESIEEVKRDLESCVGFKILKIAHIFQRKSSCPRIAPLS